MADQDESAGGDTARPRHHARASAVRRLLVECAIAPCSEFDRLAVRHGLPVVDVDGPKQRNAKAVAVLDPTRIALLVAAGSSLRWRVALALAGYAGLRLGELRALRWQDVDLAGNMLRVEWSLLPDGTAKRPKTEAGVRAVPLLPELRRLLVAWKLEAPHSKPRDLVIGTADGKPVAERNLRRAFEAAKKAARLTVGDDRLSWHALRHSFASMLATNFELPATTLAQLVGHADAGFTLKVYARDGRDTATVVSDVLDRAKRAGIR